VQSHGRHLDPPPDDGARGSCSSHAALKRTERGEEGKGKDRRKRREGDPGEGDCHRESEDRASTHSIADPDERPRINCASVAPRSCAERLPSPVLAQCAVPSTEIRAPPLSPLHEQGGERAICPCLHSSNVMRSPSRVRPSALPLATAPCSLLTVVRLTPSVPQSWFTGCQCRRCGSDRRGAGAQGHRGGGQTHRACPALSAPYRPPNPVTPPATGVPRSVTAAIPWQALRAKQSLVTGGQVHSG
jgi:hypothetical protein